MSKTLKPLFSRMVVALVCGFQLAGVHYVDSVRNSCLCRARFRMAHSFDRVGNAPRFVFQISNLKSQIRNFK